MLQTARSGQALADSLSIIWWRWVIIVTRSLERALAMARPILLPLKPLWWVPLPFSALGFLFGLTITLLLP